MRKLFRKFPIVLTAAAFLAATAGPDVRAGELASEWVEGFSNKARLIAGTAQVTPAGREPVLLAGIEITMSPGFKTYWRNPGEAGGVPPEFDFSGSQNVAAPRVLYPAPHRTKDKAGENIAYKDEVTFPVVVTPQDKTKPVLLKLKAVYGVCKDICIPAEADLDIEIPPAPEASQALSQVLATVPGEAPDPASQAPPSSSPGSSSGVGVADPAKDPVLTGWRLDRAGGKANLILEVNDPAGAPTDAFLFSADGLYMPMTAKVPDGSKAAHQAELTESASLQELAGKTISVTLVGATGQSETFIQLPKDLKAP